MSAIAVTLVALPVAYAHTPKWEIPTFAYVAVSPNPIGVGQTVGVVVWLDKTMSGTTATNDIRMHDYKLTVTKPDGTTETMNWPIVVDPTSSQYTKYTPNQVGTYTFKFDYSGQTYTWSGTYQNDTYLPSSATTTLTVQQEPIPAPITSYPLPTEYWTRPIEGQNTDWWKIASNWLGTDSPRAYADVKSRVQPDGLAPNSPHVMWSKPIQDGGVVGGSNLAILGETFYEGMTYNGRFQNPIVMYGRLYYAEPYGNSGGGGDYVCVDLRTGAELWRINTTDGGVPSFGYLYALDYYNQHGVVPNGWLFTSNFARAYDPRTGVLTTLNITNVPTGTAVRGPSGEHLRYQLTVANKLLAQWNSSKVFQTQTSGFINASLASCYDWNVTIPWLPTGATIVTAFLDDILLGRNGSLPAIGSSAPYTLWAMSLKPESRGALLWMKNYDPPAGNVTVLQESVDPVTRVFLMEYKETMQWVGYSLTDGSLLWGPTPSETAFNYYIAGYGTTYAVAYGKLYDSGYGGILYCRDLKNGSLLWTYGNGGEGNSTNSGFYTAYGRYPIWIGSIADGKLYLVTSEHSPNAPIYKEALVRCVDAYTGAEIWTIMGYSGSFESPRGDAVVAEDFLVYLNHYSMQIYCVGKGPSATTVEAPMAAITAGNSLVIRGTVTDISAGTKQNEQAARFPNGVPAVSDESMSTWMEYVYMQKPCPTNAKGVEVSIDAIDPNGNFIHIGTVTSETSGLFHHAWSTPDIPGEYTITATFTGSESYWPSYAQTAMYVEEAPAATQAPAYPAPIDYTMAIVGAAIAIIIVVVIVGILVLRKK
jgi:outer membrane protein assembly factor BamB